MVSSSFLVGEQAKNKDHAITEEVKREATSSWEKILFHSPHLSPVIGGLATANPRRLHVVVLNVLGRFLMVFGLFLGSF